MTRALLPIAIRNDYFPGGAMELVGSALAGTWAGKLLAAFRRKSLPVIQRGVWHDPSERTLLGP